jgi:hypothetical protein
MFRYLHAMAASRWCVPGLAISGTILRLLLIWYIHGHGGTAFSDEVDYDHIAQSVSSGRGYIQFGTHFTAYRAPGQPLFLALLFHLIGHHPIVAKILEAISLAIVPFVCAAAGRALRLGTVPSNIGAALATFHPGLIYASATIYPTVLTVCGLTLGLLLCSEVILKPDLRKSMAAGLSLGLAGSATTTFAPIAFLASMTMFWRRRYRDAIVVLVLGTLPVIVWMARNKEVMGQFTLATNGGYNLFLGANDDATPMSGNWVDPHLPNEYDRGELADDETYRALAVAWIKAHPARWLGLAAARSVLVVDSVGNARTQGLHSGLLGHIAGWLMLPIILMGVVGLVLSYKEPLAWLTGLALLLILISSASTIVKPRFRFPCDPLLCEFAVVGFLAARSKRQNRTSADLQRQHSQVS